MNRLFWSKCCTESERSTLARESSVLCSFDRFHLYTGSSSSPLYKEELLQRMNNETLIMTTSGGNQKFMKKVQNYTAWATYLSFPMSAWSSLSRSELSSSSFRGLKLPSVLHLHSRCQVLPSLLDLVSSHLYCISYRTSDVGEFQFHCLQHNSYTILFFACFYK